MENSFLECWEQTITDQSGTGNLFKNSRAKGQDAHTHTQILCLSVQPCDWLGTVHYQPDAIRVGNPASTPSNHSPPAQSDSETHSDERATEKKLKNI